METKEQNKLRLLLRLERSIPKLVDQGELNERIQWTLPNGRIHRDFGPAVEYSLKDKKNWYVYGQRHREDGPALIEKMVNGTVTEAYFIRGELIRLQDFLLFKKIGWAAWVKDRRERFIKIKKRMKTR